MFLLTPILRQYFKMRLPQLDHFRKHPIAVQQKVFNDLIAAGKHTAWGKQYDYTSIKTIADFQERVPISTYEQLFPYIEQVLKGGKDILWPGKVKWFSKSSGTTNDRSKYIPVTKESLQQCNYKAGKDIYTIYVNNYPDTKIFSGKTVPVGGTLHENPYNSQTQCGDISAVLMKNLPKLYAHGRAPDLETLLMDKWEEKIEAIAQKTLNQQVACLAGVPTWTILLLKRLMAITGKQDMTQVWPSLELFIHGAVNFDPYRGIFKEMIPTDKMRYLETYNASEGFFAAQDLPESTTMLLMLDYGVFFEFIPLEEMEKELPRALTLEEVEEGKTYAVVISTNAGLWRYNIGDTIRFTSTDPFRIKITGRTKHFINAFGEEVVIENADYAIAKACEATGAKIKEYTAAPIYFEGESKGGHEWVVEFEHAPNDMNVFSKVLDQTLRDINSDYDAKRYKDMALQFPKINHAPEGTFYKWMKHRGKLGGQNKVPRLSNSREHLEAVLKMA